MLNLCLAIFSSAMVSIAMRISKVRDHMALLAVNYLMCTIFSWIDTGFAPLLPQISGIGQTIVFGIISGFLFLAGFMFLQWSIRQNGVVLSATFQKLGLLVPLAVSVVCFGERPQNWQWFGFALAIAAIILMNYHPGGGKVGNTAGLLLLLLSCGGCDAMSKIFKVWGNPQLSGHFLLYTFFVAMALCVIWILAKHQGLPGKAEWGYGLLVGIPNYYSAKFLLASLNDLDAVVVYPVYCVGALLAVTLAGVLFFRERLQKRQWLALALILVALVLLNL